MSLNANLIKELREKSGAGIVDCKNALLQNNNDVDKSIDWLRKKGLNNISDVKIPIGKSLFDTYDKRPEIISAHIISEMLSVLEKKSSV